MKGYVAIEGYELLKGLAGVSTHAHLERVPILENTQDYAGLARQDLDADAAGASRRLTECC